MQFPSLDKVGQLNTFQEQKSPTILTESEVQWLILNFTCKSLESPPVPWFCEFSLHPSEYSNAPILGVVVDLVHPEKSVSTAIDGFEPLWYNFNQSFGVALGLRHSTSKFVS